MIAMVYYLGGEVDHFSAEAEAGALAEVNADGGGEEVEDGEGASGDHA